MNKDMEQQFLESYEVYADPLFRFAYFQLSDREAAKDTVQDVFMNTWKYISGGGVVENMRAFLYASARNRIIDHRRKKKDDSLDALFEAGFEAKDEHAHKNIERIAEARRIFDVVRKMDSIYGDPILLRFVEGLSIKDIAETLGESENVISVRIHRGMKQLQKQYG